MGGGGGEEEKNLYLKFKNGRFTTSMMRGLGSRCGWVIMVRLVHDTLLSQFFSPHKRVNGYRQIVREACGNAGGENRR